MAIDGNVKSVKVIQASSATALETAVNTELTTINTAGTTAVTDIKYDVERLPGNVVVYTAFLIINGVTG